MKPIFKPSELTIIFNSPIGNLLILLTSQTERYVLFHVIIIIFFNNVYPTNNRLFTKLLKFHELSFVLNNSVQI